MTNLAALLAQLEHEQAIGWTGVSRPRPDDQVPISRRAETALFLMTADNRTPASSNHPRGPWTQRLPFPSVAAGYTAQQIANRAGVNRSTVTRWRARGVPHISADLLADAFNLHPVNIWGDDYLRAGNVCHRGHEWDGFSEDSRGKRRCSICYRASHGAQVAS